MADQNAYEFILMYELEEKQICVVILTQSNYFCRPLALAASHIPLAW